MGFYITLSALYDSNLVRDIESVIVGSQTHESLLLSIGSDQGVHLSHVDVVQLLHGGLDLEFVGLKKKIFKIIIKKYLK